MCSTIPVTVVQRVLLSRFLPVLSASQFQHLLRVKYITRSTGRLYGSHTAAYRATVQQTQAASPLGNTLTAVGTIGALPAVLQHASRGGSGPRSSNGDGARDWFSWVGFAAAAAVAAGGVGVLADADDGKDRQAAVFSAELAVSEAYQEVLQDCDRRAAQQQQPDTAGSSSSSKLPPSSASPLRPQVQLDGHFLTVTIPLLPGADVPALLRLIDQKLDQLALHSSSSSQQQQTRLMGTSKLVQWDISRTASKPPSVKQPTSQHTSSREQLKVQVVLPLQPGGSPHDHSSSSVVPDDTASQLDTGSDYGYVSVVKPNGAFTADELGLLARLVAAANKPGRVGGSSSRHFSEDSWLGPFGLPGSSSHSQGGALFPGPFGGLAESMLGKVFGDVVNQIFDELDVDIHSGQSWQQQLQQQWQDAEQQLKDSVPPEVIRWLQDFQNQQQQQANVEQQNRAIGEVATAAAAAAGSSRAAAGPVQQQVLPWQTATARSAAQQLQQLGAQVYYPPATAVAQPQLQQQDNGVAVPLVDQDWGALAGYEEQKQALEDFLLLPLKHPEVFDRVASRTRKQKMAGGSRPRAVLFQGPPGTGKTSSARLLSQRAALPLVYVPLEALVSKWYGESEQNLAKLFKACESLGGCIIFLDELDSLATSRDRTDMHEASRRLLGVLLREIDGFDNTLGSDSGTRGTATAGGSTKGTGSSSRRSVLIGATNRRQDLDAALLSRFDVSIHFGLPDEQCRAAILQQYANHLSSHELSRIAEKTPGFSGRDLRDICEQTERQWASKIIRGEVDAEHLPGIDDYLANVRQRKEGAGASGRGGGHPWMNGPGTPGQYRT